MKKDIADYVAVCDVCQIVKAEHQKPAGLLQPMPIPEWKLDKLGMDFIIGLPRTRSGYDSIWVVVDRLTKVAHFIPVKPLIQARSRQDIYDQDRMSAWSSEDHRIGSRNTVYFKVLASVTPDLGYEIGVQYSIPPADRWTDRESQSDSGGHVESLCTRLWI